MNNMDLQRIKRTEEDERIRKEYLEREFGVATRLILAIALVMLALLLASLLDDQYGMLLR